MPIQPAWVTKIFLALFWYYPLSIIQNLFYEEIVFDID